MSYGYFKDLARRTAADKVLRDKAFNITKHLKYDGYQRVLASVVYRFLIKKTVSLTDKSAAGSGIKSIPQNEQLAEELSKKNLEYSKKRKVYSAFKDNIWGADLADIKLISKFDKVFRFLLCVIDIFSKYAWVVPLKDKKGVSIVNVYQSILKQSTRKPNKIWLDKDSEFYNSSFKK